MNAGNKRVNASEYYSRRADSKDNENDAELTLYTTGEEENNSGFSDREKGKIRYTSASDTNSKSHKEQGRQKLNTKSPHIRAVSSDLKKAVQNAEAKNKDEIRVLTGRMIAVEAVAVSELNIAGSTRKIIHNNVKAARYTVTCFSKKERNKRKEYSDYYKNKKEIKRAEKNIRKLKKEEKTEPEQILKDKYRKKIENENKNISNLKSKNAAIKKKRIAARHTKSINIIKKRALSDVKATSKELVKAPNRMALMISGDLEADKLIITSSGAVINTVRKVFAEIVKFFLVAVKSVLIAISPILLIAVLVIFMIYIIFFSDFEEAFNLSINHTDITADSPENDINTMIIDIITAKREEMAREIVQSDNTVQVYFVRLSDTVTDNVATHMTQKAAEEGIPSVMFDTWLSSDDAVAYLEEITHDICYRMSDDEAAAYTDEEFEAYSGNIPLPEPETQTELETEPQTQPSQPDSGPGIGLGIGAGIGIGTNIGTDTGNQEETMQPELETQPEPERRAVIGYHLS